MNELEALNARIEQLQLIVDSLIMDKLQNGNKIGAGCGNDPFAIPILEDSDEKPWTYTEEGWTNCRVQIGYSWCDQRSGAHHAGSPSPLTGDGEYYIEVNLMNNTWAIKSVAYGTPIPANDVENNKINMYIGTVKDGICTYSIESVPCAYKYV